MLVALAVVGYAGSVFLLRGSAADLGQGISLVLLVLAAGMLAIGSLESRRRFLRKKAAPYECPLCRYVPTKGQMEHGEAAPCPRCGQPLYP
jgi:predicted RNA-binding Zn-ribbon protein involved in translation (DUF1610 family)